MLDISTLKSVWIYFTTMTLALAALSSKAIESGLQPSLNIVRYSQYAHELSECAKYWKTSKDASIRYKVGLRIEHLARGEMSEFLISVREARFVM